MNHGRSRAARTFPSSATLQTIVAIALFALLAVCRLSQQSGCAAAQTHTTQAQREEQTGEKKPSTGVNQEPAIERIQPARDKQIGRGLPTSGSAQTETGGPVLTLADLERMALQSNPTLAQAQAAI